MAVYFIKAGENPTVKIGIAKNIWTRLSGIQTHNHEPVTLLALIDGGKEIEKELHRLFKKDHIRGEWFRLSPEVLRYVAKLPKPPLSAKEKQRDRLHQSGADKLWFDASIRSDHEIEVRTGFTRYTLRRWLGPSGRKPVKMTTKEARAKGKLGAANSPVAQPKQNRMPPKLARPIWRGAGSREEALHRINSDERFEDKYTIPTAYRRLGKRRG